MPCFIITVSAPLNVRPGLPYCALALLIIPFCVDAAEDVLIYYDKDTPKAMYTIYLTHDRKYIILSAHSDTSRVRVLHDSSVV